MVRCSIQAGQLPQDTTMHQAAWASSLSQATVKETGPVPKLCTWPRYKSTGAYCSSRDSFAVITGSAPAASSCGCRSTCPRLASGCHSVAALRMLHFGCRIWGCLPPLRTAAYMLQETIFTSSSCTNRIFLLNYPGDATTSISMMPRL